MATNTQVTQTLAAVQDCAKAAKSLKAVIDQVIGHNAALAIDWNNLATSNAELVVGGLVVDESVTPAEVSNAIGSLAAFQTFWTTHGSNFEKLTTPIV